MHAPSPARRLLWPILLLVLVPFVGHGQEKPPLDHEAYDIWNRIQQSGLSSDGAWFHYRVVPGHGDAALMVRATDGEGLHEIPRGANPTFTRDGSHLVFRIQPTQEAQDQARDDRNTPQPRDSLGILDLATGDVTRMDRLRGFTVPDESEAWILVHRHDPRDDEAEEPDEEPEEEAAEEEDTGPDRDRDTGTDLHYLNVETGEERVFRHVTAYEVHEDGTRFVYIAQSENGNGDGVHLVEADAAEARPLLTGVGEYARLTLDRDGTQAAFLTNRDRWSSDDQGPDYDLYHARLGDDEARQVAGTGTPGISDDWHVSANGSVSFSHDGDRILFGTAPPPLPEPDEDDELLQNVTVDIWNWQDGLLQPNQLQQLDQERNRTYQAVLHLDTDAVVQLADENLQTVSIGDRGRAEIAIGIDDVPHAQLRSWDTRHTDIYLVDVRTGAREMVLEKVRGTASLSPAARYLSWWDGEIAQWMTMDVETRDVVEATARVPVSVHNPLADRPGPRSSSGLAGWLEDDRGMVVQDHYDLWLVDPSGRDEPRNLTNGYGRDHETRLRIVRLDWDEPEIPMDEEILLSAFNFETKADGYYRTRFDDPGSMERLVMEDVSYGSLDSARDADVLLFSKSTFEAFPDLWISDGDFQGQRRLTDANPQQAEYNWGTAELVTWTSADGEELQGILYKPEDFDASREWPMMVYFYERSSNGLHNYFVPSTGTSISRSFYVSRGYVLFVPDIPYKEGYPGESAMNAVVPGVTAIVDQGYVDRDRIGVQGHSWGGYQISYMVTRTDIFAAAEAGAPVTNMTSAYGGIRWASGLVRQMQYETGQSRIGGTLWDAQHRYIENSPLFTAYKVNTPLLILHNDEDGAVPWEEGIQFFVALRRLEKPAWLINYNGQGHGVSGRYPQRDWAIRMQQFFDHYLQDAPPPVWMIEGVPAVAKGHTLGLELVDDEVAADGDGDDGSPD